MNDKDGFVMYRAYWQAIQLIPSPEDRLKMYETVCRYGLNGERPELEYPLDAIFVQMQTTCDYATRRYEEAKHGGAKGARSRARSGKVGGRPKVDIDRQEASELYARLGSWKKVAEEMNVTIDALKRRKREWETEANAEGAKGAKLPKSI